MTLLARFLAGEIAAFLLFPIAFVVWHGPDATGWLGSIIQMFFVQFISPFGYWICPLALGALGAAIWQFRSKVEV